MKKSVIVIAAVLLILLSGVAAAGWMIGARAEKEYHAGLAELNQHVMWGQFENVSYERGLLRSQARTVLHLGDDDALEFDHRISHVPGPKVKIETRFAPTEEMREAFAGHGMEAFLDTPLVTEIGLSGRSTTRYLLPPFNREFVEKSGENVTMAVEGMELALDLSADLQDFGLRFAFPYLRLEGSGAIMELRALSTEIEARRKQGLHVGRSRIDLEDFSFRLDQEPRYASFSLREVKMVSTNDIVDEFYGGMTRLDARQMTLGAENFGPLELEMALENLAAAPLQRLNDGLQAFDLQESAREEVQLQRFLMLAEVIPEIFAHRPRLVLKTIGLKGEEGVIRGKGLATFEGELFSPDPQLLLAGLVADFELELPRALLRRLIESGQYLQAERLPGRDAEFDALVAHVAEMVIEQLQDQNILVEDGAALKLKFHLEKMQPVLNGAPLAL